MPSILDHHSQKTTKSIIIGDSGTGKTGLLASLVAVGYKVRILDFDNGVDCLLPLLTSPKYPYKKYMEDHNIDLRNGLVYRTITERMKIDATDRRAIPRTARGFGRAMNMLENWIDGDIKLGHIESWDTNCILVIDTFATLADMCFYHVQAANNRLGDKREGFHYQRDVGMAQNLLADMLKMVYDPEVKCNVIIFSHMTWVDDSRGYAATTRPAAAEKDTLPDIKGFPAAIGRALSPVMGKYFNNVLFTTISGSGATTKRSIWTVPRDGVRVKNSFSAAMKTDYSVETGLAEIFAILRGEATPAELIAACTKGKPAATTPVPTIKPPMAAAPVPSSEAIV